ncbi:bifunctional serine/threonine-protein kinase/ABC transporter substrate-binding protein [Streptomyces sp. NPDC000594]|uniref:bifunctional serine/threonine-protein kinase/ABC transporter substrate-binding protein n=1 Tax=Streptomyces sp. NPDC000594 TaxID=3154261 RepID=UPI003323182A
MSPSGLGRLVAGDPSAVAGYRLLGRLGAGGMGVVYLGRTATGELAAVKVTHADQREDPDFRARFRREVEAARRVDSPWAVPVTAADPEAPEPWLATAFVPGPSLAEAVAAHGPLPPRSARILGVALARALAAVHRAGLVHRDVKPGNVLLAVDGPRLIDFGIARTSDATALTSTDMVVGTPGFLAPEQAEARGPEIGPPSDVFALGCLLAYTVTGRLPFGRGAVDALLYRTVHDEPDLAGIEPGLAALLRECLAKDPALRPTADALAELLAEDAPGRRADWLPPAVVHTIAERSARMLALPDIEATAAPAAPAEPPVPEAEPSPGRRRLLLAAGGALLTAGTGIGLWAGLRDNGGRSPGGPRRPRVVIGVQADLSGPRRAIGREQERGARLALAAYETRTVKPFELAIRVADDAGDREKALTAARRMAEDKAVAAVLGSTGDYTTQRALPVYEEALLPLMSVSAGYNVLTTKESESFIRVVPDHVIVAIQLTWFLQSYYREKKTGTARPGLLMDRTDDSYAWQQVHIANFVLGEQLGHRPHPRVVPAAVGAAGSVIDSMLAERIDAYVHAGPAKSAAQAARELRDRGFQGPRLAGPHTLSAEFLRLAGDAAEGWVVAAPVGDPARRPGAAAKAFVAAYRTAYQGAPGHYAAEAYDAVTMMIAEMVKEARGAARPDRRNLCAALRARRHRGVMGDYVFDPEKGFRKGWGTSLHMVRNGRFQFMSEAPTRSPGRSGG